MSDQAKSLVVCALRVLLAGNVQGIGYRPALARLAKSYGVRGWVKNTAAGVEVHVEGPHESLALFIENCEAVCPANGSVAYQQIRNVVPQGTEEFAILSAQGDQPTATAVPRDLAVCAQCLREVTEEDDCRHEYLLTSCNNCGPRYSIIAEMPYERESTALVCFPLCPDCLDEYQSPADRRFHAQSIACAECGPRVTGTETALDCLVQGNILAIKGIGGYQLLVDAMNPAAIEKLRQRKGRLSKPLAVMVADCASARAVAELSEAEQKLLVSPQGPIVVVRHRPGTLAAALAPNLQTIGLMLPTSPLHAWLVGAYGPLVVTSGNLEGQPLVFDSDEARGELAAIADQFIDHDRRIVRAIDDSVTRVIAGRSSTMRLARGLAPLPLKVTPQPTELNRLPHILAVGGHQKAAIALCNGSQAILGQHIGDLDTLETRARFVSHVFDMLQLYDARPAVVVHDAHTDYFTSQWAEEYCRKQGARRMAVQHHHAHVASGMLEAGWLDQKVLGVAWDGTGLGSDGTLWGGEFLTATATRFERTACLRPLSLPGGEAAIHQPWRVAAAMLRELRAWDNSVTHHFPGQTLIDPIADHPQLSPRSTSMGRLFDAVAALILPDRELCMGTIGYEGHFAAMLEDLCNASAQGAYPFPIIASEGIGAVEKTSESRGQAVGLTQHSTQETPAGTSHGCNRSTKESRALPAMLDWRPLIRGLLQELNSGAPREDIAMRFHRSLAVGIEQISRLHPELPVVLGGGVFQNKVLVELVQEKLRDRELAIPGEIPASDGGLAAGQLAIACALLEEETCV